MPRSRQECLEEVDWNATVQGGYKGEPLNSIVSVLECWYTPGIQCAIENVNYRYISMCSEMCQGIGYSTAEDELERWLALQGEFRPLEGGQHGGIRLVFCERPHMRNGMTMSKRAFLMIEDAFKLHHTTLPAFTTNSGTFAMFRNDVDTQPGRTHFVVKAPQKVEISNCTLSVTHDEATGWTNAFLCGDKVVLGSDMVKVEEDFLQGFKTRILSSPASWAHSMFLPIVLTETYLRRLELRAKTVGATVSSIESTFGVTITGATRFAPEADDWPKIDALAKMKALHTVATDIVYLDTCCAFLRGYGSFLLESARESKGVHNINSATTITSIAPVNFGQHLKFLAVTAELMTNRYSECRRRVDLQLNVLSTLIAQQASIASKKDTEYSLEIAESTKRDSISMTTFTFITALFLPPTFIATLFSMDMFDWRVDQPGSDGGPMLTNNFWIFWIVTVPLTAATMLGWFYWRRHAIRRRRTTRRLGEYNFRRTSLEQIV